MTGCIETGCSRPRHTTAGQARTVARCREHHNAHNLTLRVARPPREPKPRAVPAGTGLSAANRSPAAARRARLVASGVLHVIADISFRGLWTACTCGATVPGRSIDDMHDRYQAHRAAAKAARRAAAQAAYGAHEPDSRPVASAAPDVGTSAPPVAAQGAGAVA